MEQQDRPRCPICNQYPRELERLSGFDAFSVVCETCGRYQISGTLLSVKLTREPGHELLPRYIRQKNEFEEETPRIPHNWQQVVEPYGKTSLSQKAMKVLRVLERRTRDYGEAAPFDPASDYPLCDISSHHGARYILGHLESIKLIEKHDTRHSRITFAGWEKLDPISGGTAIPGRVFIAMWFAAEMDSAFADGFKPAIETGSKRQAIRLDKEHFTEKICDRIFAEIRRCQIGIVDLTGHRQNVYFETGFAMGLGRPVIFTCRSDYARPEQQHFDTRQYPFIEWADPPALALKLREHLDALFPEEG